MNRPDRDQKQKFSHVIAAHLARHEVIMFLILPIGLIANLIGGTIALGLAVIFAPAGLIYVQRTLRRLAPETVTTDPTGLRSLSATRVIGQRWLRKQDETQKKTACFIVAIDNYDNLLEQFGELAVSQLLGTVSKRIQRHIRNSDIICQFRESEFLVLLTPVRDLDLDICVQLAIRIQIALESKLTVAEQHIQISVSTGFSRSDQIDILTISNLIHNAEVALKEARLMPGSSFRAYSDTLRDQEINHRLFLSDAANALNNGEIQAWFQPQISTDTGEVTGFEALARWHSPKHGMVPPGEFLEIFRETGQLGKLSRLMLRQSCRALTFWESHGWTVPQIGVNFSSEELRNPLLLEFIQQCLEEYDLRPQRLAVEILESVVAGNPQSVITRNIIGLANIGCHIDLDDFGTGHASISSIRNVPIDRIKVDRSFVQNVDSDPDQQRILEAVLDMAQKLNLQTLVEGVETPGQHAMLAQLGCSQVQGFGIGRPMPLESTIAWLRDHHAKLPDHRFIVQNDK